MDRDDSKAVGKWRIGIAAFLALTASGLLYAAVAPSVLGLSTPGVSWPDFFLALGASTAVAAAFFFLAAEFTRAERRTTEAIAGLRTEVTSLKDDLQLRSDRRRVDAERTARRLLEAEDVQSVLELAEAAAARGLGGNLSVSLGGRRQLSLVTVAVEGPAGPPGSAFYLGIEEVPEHVIDPDAPTDVGAWFGRQLAMVEVEPEQSLTDALDELRQRLERAQAAWPDFADDAERALRHLSEAMSVLLQAEGVELGHLEVVLNEQYVLTRSREGHRLLVDVEHIDSVIPISQFVRAAEPPEAPEILEHPLVLRHVEYVRNAAQEAEKLKTRKRGWRAINN